MPEKDRWMKRCDRWVMVKHMCQLYASQLSENTDINNRNKNTKEYHWRKLSTIPYGWKVFKRAQVVALVIQKISIPKFADFDENKIIYR